MEIKRSLNTKFAEIFGPKQTAQYFSPGRINLIGEHTDYNGGHVFLLRSLMVLKVSQLLEKTIRS